MGKGPHFIFLSHSGEEKAFVRKLDHALRNVGHNPFFDVSSIPAGEPFPPHILRNARKCTLGVMVLSQGFLTSKWPMLELCTMHTSPHHPILLPLFFRTKPHDLKPSSPHFSTWKEAWQKCAEKDPSRVDIRKWETATVELSKIQGEVYQEHMGEDQFIKAVLLRICSIIRPPLRYVISHLTGHKRLTQVVAQLFEEVPATSHLKARALGFFAIGGQGKTTVSKLMVNHYASAYAGRCALIELPSNDCNEKEVVKQCNKALQQLTNNAIHNMDDFDQCLQWMKEQLIGVNVFIAIDNVWEVCLDFAQRILDVGFCRGSKVLVTSRSQQVLLNLLRDTSLVMPLPGVTEEEAHQIFVKSFNRNQADLHIQLKHADVHDVTESLRFHGKYHPLVINTLGVNLGRMGGHDWHTAWKLKHREFIGSGSVAEKAIKINYDSIPKQRRELFLDVSLVCIPMKEKVSGPLKWLEDSLDAIHNFSFDVVPILLSVIYKGEMEKHEISMALKQLAYDGLLEFEDSEVHVHDLYKDLAAREAAQSCRFTSLDNGVFLAANLAEAERIVCWSNCISLPKHVCRLHLPKLRVFIGNGWNLPIMPKIRVLRLSMDSRSENQMDWRSMPELSWLELEFEEEVKFSELRIARDISWLTHLCVLVLQGSCLKDADSEFEETDEFEDTDEDFKDAEEGANEDFDDAYGDFEEKDEDFEDADTDFMDIDKCADEDFEEADDSSDGDYKDFGDASEDNEVLNLDGLASFRFLCINGVDCLHEIRGLDRLINLQGLVLRNLPGLLKVGNFNSSATQLQLLYIESCNKLQEVAGLDSTLHLKTFTLVNDCALPPQLQRLPAQESLQHLDLGHLSSLPDFRGVRALKSLLLRFTTMANVRVGFRGMPSLESLFLSFVDEAIVMTVGFHGLPNLKHLTVMGGVLEDIHFPCDGLPRLETLHIYCVQRLTKLDFHKLKDQVNLRRLFIKSCHALEEIDWSSLNNLSNLAHLTISDCKQLKCISGESNSINSTLRVLEIWGCPRLSKFRGLDLLTNCKFNFK